VEDNLISANLQDSSDCVKRLICELQGKRTPDWDEALIVTAVESNIDYSSPHVQFQLAADLGRRNADQCAIVYSR